MQRVMALLWIVVNRLGGEVRVDVRELIELIRSDRHTDLTVTRRSKADQPWEDEFIVKSLLAVQTLDQEGRRVE